MRAKQQLNQARQWTPKHPKYVVFTQIVEYDEYGREQRRSSSSCQTDTLESVSQCAKIAVEIDSNLKTWKGKV